MPTCISCAARQDPRGKQINKVEYYDVTFAGVVGAARNKHQNSFSARSGTKDAHDCTI